VGVLETSQVERELVPVQIIAPTVVRFAMNHTLANNRQATCLIDVSMDEEGVSRNTALAALVPLITGVWQDRIAALFPTFITFIGSTYLDLDSLDGQSGTQGPVAGKPVHGAGTGAALTPQVALLIHKQCTHNRNQRNGRMFLPWADETAVDNAGVVGTTTINALNTAFTNLKNDIVAAGTPLVLSTAWRVVHVEETEPNPVPGRPPIPVAWSSSDVKSVFVDTKCATQRRRMRG